MKFRCESSAENPRDLKVELATRIIADFHSQAAAEAAAAEFERRFVKKEKPLDILEKTHGAHTRPVFEWLAAFDLAESKNQARQLIKQGGVRVNGEKAIDANAEIELKVNETLEFQVGKLKFLRIRGVAP
jgi:tyrosyl-tRNA synthetase